MKSSQDEKKSTQSEWSNEPLKRNDLVDLLEKTKKLTEMYQEIMKDKSNNWEWRDISGTKPIPILSLAYLM